MSGRHRRRGAGPARKIAAATLVTTLTPAVAAFGIAPAFGAENGENAAGLGAGTFNGKASADGIRATIALRDYLIVENFVDGGGPTAQAMLDSLGESTAFSSLPYPGATGVAFPGLVATLSGKSVPSYPFYVESQNPSRPTVTVRQPGYLMHAESTAERSAAQTEAGATTTTGDEFGSVATAAVDVVGGTVTSLGEARSRLAIGAFSLNGALSRAVVTVASDGKVTKESLFEAGTLHLGTLSVGVTDEGLVVGPEGAPLDPARAVEQAVTAAGVTVRFLPAVETADSVLSSGLEISVERPLEGLGNAKGAISYIVGRSFAQAAAAGMGAGTTGTVPPAGAPAISGTVAGPAGVDSASLPTTAAGMLPATVPAMGTAPAAAPVDLLDATTLSRSLPGVSFYPLLAALVPILALAVLAARRMV